MRVEQMRFVQLSKGLGKRKVLLGFDVGLPDEHDLMIQQRLIDRVGKGGKVGVCPVHTLQNSPKRRGQPLFFKHKIFDLYLLNWPTVNQTSDSSLAQRGQHCRGKAKRH